MKRTPLKRKTPMRKVSKKRAAYRQSDDGQRALQYMGYVKLLPCVCCGKPGPNDAHHTISGRYGARKSSAYDTLPLCREHHLDGPDAIHRGKASWEAKYGPDYSYIPQVRSDVEKWFGFVVEAAGFEPAITPL